jgi:electron transfer flavoprotein alpha subunit
METILYLTHTQPDGTLSKIALEVLNAARELSKGIPGSTFAAGLIGENIQPAAKSIGGSGAAKFFGVSGPDFSSSRYASDAAAAEALAKETKATMIVAPATSRFARALPGVVYRIGGRIDTHVSGFKFSGSKLEIQRWYYRQRMIATMTRTSRPWVLLLDSGVFEPWQGQSGAVSVSNVEVKLPEESKKTRVTGFESAAGGADTIRPDAAVLFVAGAGWTKKQADGQVHIKEAGDLILNFLNRTKASLGSSKSLVDQSTEGQEVLSFMTHLNQVGQTGSTPRHPKGLSTCCHGEEPHVVGWRFINERRAVNLDPNCGWAQGKADVLYVADAFQVVAKVNELLAKEPCLK